MILLEVRVTEMMNVRVFPVHGFGFPETVQVELTDEARVVGGLEGVRVAQGAGGRQDLSLHEPLIDDDTIASDVPADGFNFWVVYQTPQLSGKVGRVDVWLQAFTNIHCLIYREAVVTLMSEHLHIRPTVNSSSVDVSWVSSLGGGVSWTEPK